MVARFTHNGYDFTFADCDIVNPSDFIPAGEYNPHNVRPFLIHDHGYPVAIAFASCLQDALDTAADGGKLAAFRLTEEDKGDYDEQDERVEYLGSPCDTFDIQTLDVLELPIPAFSFVALFEAAKGN